MEKSIIKKIHLPARFLDSDYEKHIMECLKESVTMQCDQENGYILGVGDSIKILDNTIASSAATDVYVEYTVKSLKPKKGDVYKGVVCMIFSNGIFVEVEGCMKVLIPSDNMEGYKYNKTKNVFVSHNKNDTISEGSSVKMVINTIKYEKQNFNCIGSLKTK